MISRSTDHIISVAVTQNKEVMTMFTVIPDNPAFPPIGPFNDYADAYIAACEYVPQGDQFTIEED